LLGAMYALKELCWFNNFYYIPCDCCHRKNVTNDLLLLQVSFIVQVKQHI